LITYRNIFLSNGTISSPILHDVPFSHNTCVTNDRQTDRRHIVPKAQFDCKPKIISQISGRPDIEKN